MDPKECELEPARAKKCMTVIVSEMYCAICAISLDSIDRKFPCKATVRNASIIDWMVWVRLWSVCIVYLVGAIMSEPQQHQEI